MATEQIILEMETEELAKMLPPLKAYRAVPFVVDAEGKVLVDDDGEPTGEVIDDYSYLKTICMDFLERCYTKGAKKIGTSMAVDAIDKNLIKIIKIRNLA
jgi:hypothetical protein